MSSASIQIRLVLLIELLQLNTEAQTAVICATLLTLVIDTSLFLFQCPSVNSHSTQFEEQKLTDRRAVPGMSCTLLDFWQWQQY